MIFAFIRAPQVSGFKFEVSSLEFFKWRHAEKTHLFAAQIRMSLANCWRSAALMIFANVEMSNCCSFSTAERDQGEGEGGAHFKLSGLNLVGISIPQKTRALIIIHIGHCCAARQRNKKCLSVNLRGFSPLRRLA
jgi:hypothetical protein